MNYSEYVKEAIHTCVKAAGEAEDEIEKAYYNAICDSINEKMSAISLARIASALYKIAGMDDQVEEDFIG